MGFFKSSVLLAMILLVVGCFSGCKGEKKEFDFSNATAVRVFTANEEQQVTILDESKTQDLVKGISADTWVEVSDADSEEFRYENRDWIYRVQCYNKKGTKKQNIYIFDENTIFYKNAYWSPKEEGTVLDIAGFQQLFAQQ